MRKQSYGICEAGYSGCKKNEATYGPDPYAWEINGDETPCWLCDNCAHERAMDI